MRLAQDEQSAGHLIYLREGINLCMHTCVHTHKCRSCNTRMQCQQCVHNTLKMDSSSWDHGTPESLHRERNSWSEFWKFSFCCIGEIFVGKGSFFTEAWLQLSCVFRKEGAVWHDWPCGWAILVGWIQTQWAIRLRDMRRPETYQRAVIQGTFVGRAVGDTMIIFVSPKDYFRKKCARLIRYKTRARWLQGKFLQQPQWESLWHAELTEMG